MTVGEKINELRKAKNMTLKQLALKSGISAVTLTNWKTGKTRPQPVMLKRVADALGCDFQELLDLL